MKNKKRVGTWIGIAVLAIAVVFATVFFMEYRRKPLVQSKSFKTDGILILSKDYETYQQVPVRVEGVKQTYLFGNQNDALRGKIKVFDTSIFGDDDSDEFCVLFDDEYPEFGVTHDMNADVMCNVIGASKDWKSIVCGLEATSDICADLEEPTPALLVISSTDLDQVEEVIQKACEHPAMKKWMQENGWNR